MRRTGVRVVFGVGWLVGSLLAMGDGVGQGAEEILPMRLEFEWRTAPGSVIKTRPVTYDMDGDGVKEILVGQEGPGFPLGGVVVPRPFTLMVVNRSGAAQVLYDFGVFDPSSSLTEPILTDLDHDGSAELLIALNDSTPANADALYCLTLDGAVKWVHAFHHDEFSSPSVDTYLVSPLLVVDLDQDGQEEVLVGTSKGLIVFASDGAARHFYSGDPVYSTGGDLMAAGDIDADGHVDVVAQLAGRYLGVIRADGTLAWRYNFGPAWAFTVGPILVDLDGDGRSEIVVGVYERTASGGREGHLFILSAAGEVVWEVPVGLGRSVTATALAAGDLDRDGLPELLVVAESRTLSLISYRARQIVQVGGPFFVRTMIVADANHDGSLEILAGGGIPVEGGGVLPIQAVLGLDGQGRRLQFYYVDGWVTALLAEDLDADDRLELVVTARSGTGETASSTAFVLELGPAGGQRPWPMWMHDDHRTGNYAPLPPFPGDWFIRGDANGDGHVTVGDAVTMLRRLFLDDSAPCDVVAADANDDGDLDISDPVFLMQVIYLGRGLIPPPFPDLGPDPTP